MRQTEGKRYISHMHSLIYWPLIRWTWVT